MLHKLSIQDEKQQLSLVGIFLDDAKGPPSKTILNHLICRNEYQKDLAAVMRLDSFSLMAYSKERDFCRASDFLGYLKGRNKAAKVIIDKTGTSGFLFPGPPAPDGIPCLKCYYASNRVPQQQEQQRPLVFPKGADVIKRTAPSAGARGEEEDERATKRARATANDDQQQHHQQFQYIPPDPLPVVDAAKEADANGSRQLYHPSSSPINGEGHGGAASDNLRHPSLYPKSKDPRFAYIPPTLPPGVEIPAYYQDDVETNLELFSTPVTWQKEEDLSLEGPLSLLPAAATSSAGVNGSSDPSSSLVSAAGGGGWGKDQKMAEGFYNSLKRDKGTRNQSLIFHMRKFNNWVKSLLINELRPTEPNNRELEVLDLACGKGGDFTKWREVSKRFPIARYVGVDIAKSSLVDGIGRYHGDKNIRSSLGAALTLACADLGATNLVEDEVEVWEATEDAWTARPLLDEDDQFDVVMMQFALHYMFEDEGRARHFFQAAARHLRPGGTFIATTVDARVVVEMLAGLGEHDAATGDVIAHLRDEEQRELCRLQVDGKTFEQIFRKDPSQPSPFCGLRYKFVLKDGTEEDGADAVNAPEWMIPLPLLAKMAGEYGLELDSALNFHEVVQEYKDKIDGGPSGRGIRWVNHQGSISPTEWEIARIYVALKFRRVYTS